MADPNLLSKPLASDFASFWRSLDPGDYGVYRAYDEANRLLYVGITRGLRARFRQHYDKSGWIGDVSRLEFDPGKTEEEARAEEKRQIQELQPLYNKMFVLPMPEEELTVLMDPEAQTLPTRYAAALDVLSGMPFMVACEKHGIDKGQFSRFLAFTRNNYERKLREAEQELYFWEEVIRRLDNSDNGV